MEPYELVERNLRYAMAFYAGGSPVGEMRELDGVAVVNCGWNYPVFNSALLMGAARKGEQGARLAGAAGYYRGLGMGWSYWACHDLLEAEGLRRLRETCFAEGMDPVVTAPGMIAESLLAPRRKELALEIRDVNDEATRVTFAHLVSTIFDLPFRMTMHMYGSAVSWTGGYAGFIGYVRDRPATIAMVAVADGCCGFYSVGTVPEHRGSGYAESVMREALRRMKSRLSFETCVLQSSTVGRRLYEQMGFREVTQFSVFRSTPHK